MTLWLRNFFAATLFAIFGAVATTGVALADNPPSDSSPAISTPFDPGVSPGAFYLHDRDTVVFYGDSITEQRRFTEYVASYCVTRFPTSHFRFINSGWGYDTVEGGPGGTIDARLKRDVIRYKPAVVVVALGSNDAGSTPFSSYKLAQFVAGYCHILDTLTAAIPGVRLTLLAPPAYDDVTRPPAFAGGINQVLIEYASAVKALAARYHGVYVDCNAPLAWFVKATLDKKPAMAKDILPDRIHPDPAGHILIAASILKAWKAPGLACETVVNAMTGSASGTGVVTDYRRVPGDVAFTLKDACIPWPLDREPLQHPDVAFLFSTTRLERDLNLAKVKITGIGPIPYRLSIDGVDCGQVTGAQCAYGLDLGGIPSPIAVQSRRVLDELRSSDNIAFEMWRQIDQYTGSAFGDSHEIDHRRGRLAASKAAADENLREDVLPVEHRFELKRITTLADKH